MDSIPSPLIIIRRRARGDAVEGEGSRGGLARIALEERSAGPVTTSTGERKTGQASPRDEPADKEPRARRFCLTSQAGWSIIARVFFQCGEMLVPKEVNL